MDSTKRVMKFQGYSMKKAILAFWGILLMVNLFVSSLTIITDGRNIQFGPYIKDGDVLSIAASNIMPIIIFFIVYGILVYYEDFTIALCFGVTRKDYYKSVIANHLITVLSFAIIQTILLSIEKFSARFFGYNLMVEFGLFNISKDNIFFIIFALFIIFLTNISIANLVGILQYRYKYKFWIGFGIAFIIIISIFSRLSINVSLLYQWAINMFGKNLIFIVGSMISLIFYSIGYTFFRKANIS